MDAGVLKRAEWVKFLGVFYNMDASSSEIFSAINESYYQTVSDIQVCNCSCRRCLTVLICSA